MVSVEVKIELGHRAVMKERPSPEGFTHDWTIFVRGVEGNNIHFFVEKVVFHLHESFPKPKRVVKEPPYSVSESGYAGFIMPIDVYFRSREEPKRVTFKYDLYLRLESSPVNNIRIEKLTFNNPSDDFRNKLIKAGGIANTTGSASGGSASLSTQACVPPSHIEDLPPVVHPKPVVADKKPRPHVASKEIKSSQPPPPAPPPPPKPSQPFTEIFGTPIRTKSSPDTSSVKSKDSGHSSQVKSKSSLNNSSSSSSTKEGKSSSKESHKSKDNHHSNKESRHISKENHHSSKESHLTKEPHHSSKEVFQDKSTLHQSKDSAPAKESHQSTKEAHHKPKEHHLKEGHKKESHHSSKEAKLPKDHRSSNSKDSKPPKPIKLDKESNKSGIKRAAPTDSHGTVEKKRKLSPVPSESSDKTSSHSKHKTKESKDKTAKQKIKLHSNSLKKEEERSKHKSSPAPLEPAEPKEMPKPPKPCSPKPPSTPPLPPPPVVKQQLPPKSPPPPLPSRSPSSHSSSSDSDAESHKSLYNKAHYSSPASSISESSLHSNIPVLSDRSIISPLSDDDDDDDNFSPPPKRKISSDYDLDDRSQEPKSVESRPVQKLTKKPHYKSSKHKSENFHHGNGSIHSDVSMHHSPSSPEEQSNSTNSTNNSMNNSSNNSSYLEELVEIQRKIMSSEDRRLLQNIVDVIETTGKYEITSTTFDFDLCSLDRAIIQKIKLYLTNCDKC